MANGRDLFDAFADAAEPKARRGHERSEGERRRARALGAPGSHTASKETFAISRAILDSISHDKTMSAAKQPASLQKSALQGGLASKQLLAKAVQEQHAEAAENGKFLEHSKGGPKPVKHAAGVLG
jgi:hypothetical protein